MLPMKSNLSLVTLKYLKNYLDAPILKMYPRSIVVDLRKIYELKCRVFVGNKCGLKLYIKEINPVQYTLEIPKVIIQLGTSFIHRLYRNSPDLIRHPRRPEV